MTADLFSPFIGMTLQATGNNNNAWGTILNGSALSTLERRISGNIVRAVTGGTLDLSENPPPNAVSQVLDFIQIFQGTLTVNQIVILPNLSGYWYFINETTGAFQVLLQTPGGAFINIPQGTAKLVTCDGAGNLVRSDRDQVGNFEYNAVSNAGTLAANGASVLRTDFPDLFAKYGTTFGSVDSLHFTLPLLTDTNRYLRAADGINLVVGTSQSNQNKSHTHTAAGSTGNESAQHTHTQQGTFTSGGMSANDPHAHSYTAPATPAAGQANGGSFPAVTSTGGSTTGETSIAHTHNVTISGQTGTESTSHTHAFNVTTSDGSADGTEARPESLAVTVSIRY